MLKNLEELQLAILSGKTNEEIVQDRINYLTSDEYKSNRLKPIFNEYNQLIFYDGYVQPNIKICHSFKSSSKCYYEVDVINSVYSNLIDYIRNNMTKGEFSIYDLVYKLRENGKLVQDSLMMQIWKYFLKDESEKYYKVAETFREAGNMYKKPRYSRDKTPHLIYLYEHTKDFEGTLDDFILGYRIYDIISHSPSLSEKLDEPKEIENYEKFMKSSAPSIFNSNFTLPLSKLKGLEIAACTENSMLTQNCLAFLGFESYVLCGKIEHDGISEGHHFNVIKRDDGLFSVIDTAQYLLIPELEEVYSIEDLIKKNKFKGKRSTKDATEVVYTINYELKVDDIKTDFNDSKKNI